MVATQLKSRQVLGLNQRQYEGLKMALQLKLRRQLLIAVCDSDSLQTELVSRLQSELSASDTALDDFGAAPLAQLTFNPHQPDLILQLVHWLKQAPQPTPHLQVVGLDGMTHQSMRSQNHFLRSIEGIHSLLPHLEGSLVLWLSWPWYRTLQQSAPEFWQWRSGVFTFVGEPVSIPTHTANTPSLEEGLYGGVPTAQNADIWQILSEDLAQLEHTSKTADTATVTSTVNTSAPDRFDPDTSHADTSHADTSHADTPDTRTPATDLSARANPQPIAIDVTTLENPLHTLAQLEAQGASPVEITQAYRALGNYYRDRIEAGEMTPNLLTTAIKTFELYLHWLPADDAQRAAGLNDLGTLYWLQAQHQSERSILIEGMNRSAELYKQGLSIKADDDTTSRLYGNLGAVYSALANYDDSVSHLHEAVSAYRQALSVCPVDAHPQDHGTLQNSLGSVYWKLAYYEQPQAHLHSAIVAYSAALRCHPPKTSPMDYAAVQNNLGIAYWSLSRYEQPIVLLKRAIAAYRDALNYRTPTTDPTACASTYNNLGTAFWELANHAEAPSDPEGHHKQNAVIAYEAALKASELAPTGLDLASIRHCLGSIYDKMARAAEDNGVIVSNLERALTHYTEAIKQTPKTAATYKTIFKALVRNVSTHYELLGLEGQQTALQQLPAEILPEVMLKL